MSQAITQPVYAEWEFETYEKNPIPPVYPHDSEGIDVYSAKLDAARKHAYHNPLAAGQSYKLALTVPQTNPCPSARRVPHVPQSPSVFVRLDRPLQTGAGNMSQVWTAGVEGTGTTLVLKIIQPSLCPYPAPDRCWTMYEAPEDLARGEAWAYERIVHKQGLLVPYFFGLDQITTPSGEPAWVLALEYIPSVTLASFLDSPARSFWDICDLVRCSLPVDITCLQEYRRSSRSMPRRTSGPTDGDI
ncbi:hypothetical protein DFH06DRAFT_1017149 [Mycena polygramma]|nr:hypothetical protein DFH06DRAFT_1017149 [Mycena polygramma]